MVTVTPGTAAPLESVTFPINPVLAPICAEATSIPNVSSTATTLETDSANRRAAFAYIDPFFYA
jgi:hypothetical protein